MTDEVLESVSWLPLIRLQVAAGTGTVMLLSCGEFRAARTDLSKREAPLRSENQRSEGPGEAGQMAVSYLHTPSARKGAVAASERVSGDIEGHVDRVRKRRAWRRELEELRRLGLAPPADETDHL